MQGGDDDRAARDGIAGAAQEIEELFGQLRARGCFPSVLEQPVGERIAVQTLGAGDPERHLVVAVVQRRDLAEVKGDVAADLQRVAVRLLIAPGRVLDRLAADLQAPVAGVALERAVGVEIGLTQELHAHVLGREVVGGRKARLVHHQRALRIGDPFAVEFGAYALRAGFGADLVIAHHIPILAPRLIGSRKQRRTKNCSSYFIRKKFMRQTLTDCPFVSISATNRAHKICEAKARPAHRWRAGPGITGLRGAVNIIRPNKSVIQIERFEPTEIFNNKEEAEAYGLNLAIELQKDLLPLLLDLTLLPPSWVKASVRRR